MLLAARDRILRSRLGPYGRAAWTFLVERLGSTPGPRRRCIIDLQAGPSFCGTGDGILLAWLASAAPQEVALNTTDGKWDCLNCLDIPLLKKRSVGMSPSPLFDMEVRDRGAVPRLERARQYFGIRAQPRRPNLRLPPHIVEAAERFWRGKSPRILFCPEVNEGSRRWSHWTALEGLWEGQYKQLTYRMCEVFAGRSDLTWAFAWAAVAMADVVVGVDSAYMHMAATTNTAAVCVMAATRPTVFAHAPNVRCVVPPAEGTVCAGCCFGPPFNTRCSNLGCFEMSRVSPEATNAVMREVLGGRVG